MMKLEVNKNMSALKLDKYQLNKYLYKLKEYDETYYIILKLCYIYGKNTEEITPLKREDIKYPIIQLNSKPQSEYPLPLELRDELENYIKEHVASDEEQIFPEVLALDNHHVTINEFLRKTNRKIEKKYYVKLPSLTTRDFKRLRGQHLILDGVTVQLVRRLYNNSNTNITRKFLQLDNLLSENNKPVQPDDIINYYTDMNVFWDKNYNENYKLYHIRGPVNYHNNLEIDTANNSLTVENPDVLTDGLMEDQPELIADLVVLKPGEYRKYDDLMVTRTL